MPCCEGRCCPQVPEESRYPVQTAPVPEAVYAAAPNGLPQFDYPVETVDAPFTYSGDRLAALSFPLGGFGCGNIVLQGDGNLGGWAVVNQVDQSDPQHGTHPLHILPGCFFGVRADTEAPQAYALLTPQTHTAERRSLPPGPAAVPAASVRRLQAIPGVRQLTLVGRYPIADVTFDIPGFPVEVALEAMTPVVPGDTAYSSLPCAAFRFSLRNPGTSAVRVRLLQSQQNFIGWDGKGNCLGQTPFWGGNVNAEVAAPVPGLVMTGALPPEHASFGTLALGVVGGASEGGVLTLSAATEEELWAAFAGDLPAWKPQPSPAGQSWVGGVVQTLEVPAQGTAEATFLLCWHFPNRQLSSSVGATSHLWDKLLPQVLGNYYAAQFSDATAVLAHCAQLDFGRTRLYRDVLYRTTIPPEILDSAASKVATMNCPTLFRSKDGIVLGTEGNGCCPLNCTHVYGYSMLMERLFPDLAKDMLYSVFVRVWDAEQGGCVMRYGTSGWAIDGALACVIKAYICVRQADSALQWLPTVWPHIKAQMEYVLQHFDEGDGTIVKPQQNTYDTAMKGRNTFIGSYYVTALRSCAAMARLMEDDAEQTFADRAALAAAYYERACWDEDFGYYVACVNIHNCQNSYGPGCFVDQLCACGLACAAGLGHVFDRVHEASARKQILANNLVHKPPFQDMQRHLSDGDTALCACTYPHGKLGKGMTYDTIVSTGFNYPVLAGLLLDRNVDAACQAARYIRQRFDGRNATNWNEPECGLHYSRSMDAWNLYDQACGLGYESTSATLAVDPRFNAAHFSCMVVAEAGWGELMLEGTGPVTASLHILEGSMPLAHWALPGAAPVSATLGNVPAPCTYADGVVTFDPAITLAAGETVTVSLAGAPAEPWVLVTEAAAADEP